MQQLKDTFDRGFYYLRLSITDVCNFRCSYCLPDGYRPQANTSFLRADEARRIAQAFIALGTDKIRLTGGEPTLRRDFISIASSISELPGLR
ncbi:MAG: radical SAM protein, partial [Plesiomonas shigelloides]